MGMTILETQIYRGANYWAPMPVIRVGGAADESDSGLL
jgi:hypothetical protein